MTQLEFDLQYRDETIEKATAELRKLADAIENMAHMGREDAIAKFMQDQLEAIGCLAGYIRDAQGWVEEDMA